MRIDINKSLSYETIYSYVRYDKANGGNLYKMLPHAGKKYKYGKSKGLKIINRVDISEHPAIVDKKSRIGDFEIDTVVSAKSSGKGCLLTMVDRRSKFTFIRKLVNKSALEAQSAIEDILSEYYNTI